MDSLPGMPWPLPWPFDRTYMQLALVAGVVVGAAAPCVGTFLVQKRLSLLGDGIGHAAVAGVGAGLLVGTGPTWTALGMALSAALAVEWLRARGSASADLALALIFYGGIAAGVVLASRSTETNLQPYLFGSILTVDAADAYAVLGLGALIFAATAVMGRALLAVVLDEDSARVSGVPAPFLNAVLAVLTAVTVVASMRIVGVLLVAALMVLPVASSRLLARSFRGTLAGAVGVGVVSVVTGLAASRQWALASGGTIVLVAVGVFILFGTVQAMRSGGRGASARGLLSGPG
jgi:zinc transport system permease protein